MIIQKHIEFDYVESEECSGDNCCCKCENQIKVTMHCLHFPIDKEKKEGKCICKAFLGFYVCIALHNMDKIGTASVIGEHGECECFQEKKKITTNYV